eukprot:1654300-Rhodomonas_salina.2
MGPGSREIQRVTSSTGLIEEPTEIEDVVCDAVPTPPDNGTVPDHHETKSGQVHLALRRRASCAMSRTEVAFVRPKGGQREHQRHD